MTKNATCAGKGVISDKMVNEVEVEDPNADLSQSGCGVNETKEKKTAREWDPRTQEQTAREWDPRTHESLVMVDSGASVNVLPRWFGNSKLEQSDGATCLRGANGKPLQEYGRQIWLNEHRKNDAYELTDQKTDGHKLTDSRKTDAYKLMDSRKTDAYKLMDSQKTDAYKLTDSRKTDAYKLTDSQKSDAYKLTDSQKSDAYKLTDSQKTAHKMTDSQKIHAHEMTNAQKKKVMSARC